MAKQETRPASRSAVRAPAFTGAGLLLLGAAMPELLSDAPRWAVWLVFGLGIVSLLYALIVSLGGDNLKALVPKRWRARQHERKESRLPGPPWVGVMAGGAEDGFDDEWDYLDAKDRGEHGKRDKSLAEALAFIAYRAWGREYTQATADMIPNALSELRQRAHDGRIIVWGRFHPDELYRPIPQEHWSDHRVDPGALLNGYARTWGNDTTNYGHLMVSRAEIEREWPYEG